MFSEDPMEVCGGLKVKNYNCFCNIKNIQIKILECLIKWCHQGWLIIYV